MYNVSAFNPASVQLDTKNTSQSLNEVSLRETNVQLMFSLVPKPNGSLQEIVQTEYGGFRKYSLTSVCVTSLMLKKQKTKSFCVEGEESVLVMGQS